MVIFQGETWSILHTAWLNCSRGSVNTLQGEVVPLNYISWKEKRFVLFSRSSYQLLVQRVIMSYKWDYNVRNGDVDQVMCDFIHTREYVVYSPLVKPTTMQGLHHVCGTRSMSIVTFDPSGSYTMDSFKFRDI